MIALHTLAPAWDLPTFTPFGLKLIAYMSLTNIPFEIKTVQKPADGPKGKVPWIVDEGHSLADSGFIVEYLEDKHGSPLDGWLSAEERARGHAMRKMIEESLCFSILYFRWTDPVEYRASTEEALRALPALLRRLLPRMIRSRILRDLRGQGMGRHKPEEVLRLGKGDLRALSDSLGDKPYLVGTRPSSVDASAAAFLAVLLRTPFEGELSKAAQEFPNLIAYEARLWAKCFATPQRAE